MAKGNLVKARKLLVSFLSAYKKFSNKDITVVFDGKKQEGLNITNDHESGIRILYSLEASADFIINQYIFSLKNPGDYTVVTSDKEIILFVKSLGAKVLSSDEFAELVKNMINPSVNEEEDKSSEINLGKEEIEFWKKVFSEKGK